MRYVLNVGALMQGCHDPKVIVFDADQQTRRGLANACRIIQHGREYGLQFTRGPADDVENFGRRGELLQRLVTLAGASRELRFPASRGTATDRCLWRIAAL
jgi:hypothetical protein